MKFEKRTFIRALRGVGLTLPERAKLYRAIRREKAYNADEWANVAVGLFGDRVLKKARMDCDYCGKPFVDLHFVKRDKIISLTENGISIVNALNVGD